jgi:hypothetical protein
MESSPATVAEPRARKPIKVPIIFCSDLYATFLPRGGGLNPVDLPSEVSVAPPGTEICRADEESWPPDGLAKVQTDARNR